MKKNTHPQSHSVIFKDVSSNEMFLTTSTLTSKETVQWTDGQSYPLIKVDISSASHPFYTKSARPVDTEGRAEKFKQKYAQFKR